MPLTESNMCEVLGMMNYLIGFTAGMMKSLDELNASNGKEINKKLTTIYLALISE